MVQYENRNDETKEKRVAVVILNWNGRELMRRFLPSVVANTPDWADVIVADNGSTDGSIEMLEQEFPSVGILCLDQNYGFAEGYNRALDRIEHPYCVLLNSDVEVTPHWLDAPIHLLDTDPTVAAVQPKILAWHDKQRFEYAGAAGGFIDRLGYPFCRGRVLGTVEEDRGQYDAACDVFWASGACLLVRAKDFWEAGALDAGFFAHMEEIDLCWRLRSRGRRVVCVPQSVVYHVGGGTLAAESPYKTYLNYRNNLLMLYKNLPEGDLHRVMRCRYVLDYLSALHLLLTGRFRNAAMVFKARHDYKRLRPKYASKRHENMQQAVVRSIPEVYPHSLILRYYLRGAKTFRKLMGRR